MGIKNLFFSALALFAISFFTVKLMEKEEIIPRKILFGNPDKRSVSLSPDGKYFAYLAPRDGVLNLWIAPASDIEKASPVTDDRERGIRSYLWAYDGKHIFFEQDEKGDENFRIYAHNIETGETKSIAPPKGVRSHIKAASHKKPDEILFSTNGRDKRYFDLYKLNLKDYSSEIVFRNEKFSEIMCDYDLNIVLAVLTDPSGGEEYFKYSNGSLEPFMKISLEDSSTTGSAGFDAKGNFYMFDGRDSEYTVLKKIDTKTLAETILASSSKGDVSILTKHPLTKEIQAVEIEYDKTSIQILDESVKGDIEYLKSLSEGDLIINSRTLDDKYWIVAISGDAAPVKYYKYDREAKKANFLFTDRPDLEKYRLAKMEPVIIKSRDGLDLVSYITFPEGSKKNLPAVLSVHGGPWARDSWGFNPLHQWLANRGYAVLSVNFRGSTGLGKSFANAGNGEWGKKMQEDLIDAVAWGIGKGFFDPSKIAIMGGSYGGYATLAGLTFTPDLFACGVDIVGPSNIYTLISSVPPYWEPILSSFKKRVGPWDTEEDKKALADISPLNHAHRIKKPLLIGQGSNDPRVKQAESDQIVEYMKGKGLPVLYALYMDEGHGFARPENRLSFYSIAEEFLSKNLGGKFEPVKNDSEGSSLILNGKKTNNGEEISKIIERTFGGK